jgi:ubiquinol-cytochrome c reductase cytochrome b subunit
MSKNKDKIPFNPHFTATDILTFAIIVILLSKQTLGEPCILGDPDNFTPANPLVTPVHIETE